MKKSIVLFLSIFALMAFTGCSQPKPIKTIENLKAGIKGETTASAKYLAFAEKARLEGFEPIAKLFEAASKAESIHAANHLKVLESLGEKMETFAPEFEVKATSENLQAAIDGESYEANTMYPGFLEAAKAEKVDKAVKSFNWAMDTEMKHKTFYTKAMDAISSMNVPGLPVGYVVCPVCGNTYDATMVESACAFCGTAKEKFLTI
ncbi:MAG TPA: ferritin family protein [Bacteroidales bacterium]|nr:ferritin family protein [Bacteroidales bacterium]